MKIFYVYDALCGWCYGFSPTMQRFADTYQAELEFEVISGGMIVGDRIGPIGEVAGYIGQAYREVEQATGVEFGAGFLEGTLAEGTAIFTSVPAALAMRAFKLSRPEQALAFAGRMQRAIYYEGMKPEELAGYAQLATEFGLDRARFLLHMNDETTYIAAQAEFQLTQQWGINGFPTLLLEYGDEEQLGILSRGYLPYEQLEKAYLKAKEILGQKR
jgi:putative protein-disulfide isomerase